MGMILRIASSRIVGQGDIVGRSGYFSLNLSANSVMRGRLDARRTLKSLVADLRKKICFIDLEITFLLSVMRNLAHLALAGNRRSVSTSTLYIYLLYISMGVELLLIILVRACQSLS